MHLGCKTHPKKTKVRLWAQAEEEAILEDAAAEAAEAFDEADFGFEGELTFQAFMEAMDDPIVAEKISAATHIPLDYLNNLTYDNLAGFFQEIDTDMCAPLFLCILTVAASGKCKAQRQRLRLRTC